MFSSEKCEIERQVEKKKKQKMENEVMSSHTHKKCIIQGSRIHKCMGWIKKKKKSWGIKKEKNQR